MFCGCSFRVSPASFMSFLLAPPATTASGTPFPATNKPLFVPGFYLSVGFGPVLFPLERCLHDGTVHSLPFTVYPLFRVVFQKTLFRDVFEHFSHPSIPGTYRGRCSLLKEILAERTIGNGFSKCKKFCSQPSCSPSLEIWSILVLQR